MQLADNVAQVTCIFTDDLPSSSANRIKLIKSIEGKTRRLDKTVEREIQFSMVRKIEENPMYYETRLPEGEEDILESCKEFSDKHDPETWVGLPKNSPFVSKYGKPSLLR